MLSHHHLICGHCQSTFRTALFLLVTMSLGFMGCAEEQKSGPPSVMDLLVEAEKTNKELTPAPPTPPTTPADTSSTPSEPADSSVPATGIFKARFETSVGDFVIQVDREWAPIGAERFFQLVKSGFYDECRFFRVIPGFMVQFGINGDPVVQQGWDTNLKDDPVVKSNTRGFVTFATSGPNSRTTQIFINFGDNARLDGQGFSPFGEVIEGMEKVDLIYSGDLEKPNQQRITLGGNAYLKGAYPKLDFVTKATIIEDTTPANPDTATEPPAAAAP